MKSGNMPGSGNAHRVSIGAVNLCRGRVAVKSERYAPIWKVVYDGVVMGVSELGAYTKGP